MIRTILPSIALALLSVGIARAQDQWNLGSTPEKRAAVAEKLRCGNPPNEPASAINVVQVLKKFDWKQDRSLWVGRIIPEDQVSALKNPDTRSEAERLWMSNYATAVYSSLTIDCFIAALTDVAFYAKGLSEELTKRFDIAEAKTKTITNENYVALLARVDQLEEEVKQLKEQR
ncbi:hypothetical protein CN198_13950 [Sinorhizobium meliloti]|uniref:hypothetical protein n=1 Tax=Rhizobium meliloti TaxID=382 RepID=UPI000FD72630|nr:hypothetical protein [Sinorhizobium meliloti]RVH69165.1 hypothetical protein CN198_13950 [Sinorhizobium meliloti]